MKVLNYIYGVNILLTESEQVWEDSDSMFHVYQMTFLDKWQFLAYITSPVFLVSE
jgi:hypothetical protein